MVTGDWLLVVTGDWLLVVTALTGLVAGGWSWAFWSPLGADASYQSPATSHHSRPSEKSLYNLYLVRGGVVPETHQVGALAWI